MGSPEGADLAAEIGPIPEGGPAARRTTARAIPALTRSARKAGLKAVLSGQWMTSVVSELAPHLPIRSEAILRAHYRAEGGALAHALAVNSARTTGAIGATAGALASGAEASGVGLLTLPVPVVVDAILTALVEMKMIAELHEALGQPIPGRGARRAIPLLQAWAVGRGVTGDALLKGGSVLASGAARRELANLLRRKLLRRTRRSLTALAPALVGGLAAAIVNRRGTLKLAVTVRSDLERSMREEALP